ncbi:threonine-rich protein-like [Diorhabda sublineata]|uniref:threonine-rich protein-like n=1 Tax=Diorhabda sublineata TaxID=1163346 RepID=UPI0024E09EB9|nr:threonine-rich protein-like [Diorhabda sublineata]XP_056642647.1 threonine-rich protein-like [Diorhabda sublineata]
MKCITYVVTVALFLHSSSPLNTAPISSNPISCVDGDVTANLLDCHSFLICVDGQWTGPIDCPTDLYWNEQQKSCVDLEDSDCDDAVTSTSTSTSTTTVSSTTTAPTTTTASSTTTAPTTTTASSTTTASTTTTASSTTTAPTTTTASTTTTAPTTTTASSTTTATTTTTASSTTTAPTTTTASSTTTAPTTTTASSTTTAPTTTTASTTTTVTSSTEDLNMLCDTELEYFADPADCRGFYQCVEGTKQHEYCPENLLWNVRVQACDVESDCSQVTATPGKLLAGSKEIV